MERDSNSEADALTNENFQDFSPDLRIQTPPGHIKFLILDSMMEAGLEMYDLIEEEKNRNKPRCGDRKLPKKQRRHRFREAW